eukprot:4294444-Prymnesium_polylepis.1
MRRAAGTVELVGHVGHRVPAWSASSAQRTPQRISGPCAWLRSSRARHVAWCAVRRYSSATRLCGASGT